MTDYIALIRKEADSDFGVDFPDFPGCVTAGRTLDEAKDMAREALELHIEGMIEDGEAVPPPSSLDRIMADPANADAVAFLVTVAQRREKAERYNITMAPSIMARIDAAAAARGMNRSQYIAWAATPKKDESDAA